MMKSILSFIFIIITNLSFAQQYYYLECNITIKEKISESQFSLVKGKAYFDKYKNVTTLDFIFPEKVKWILTNDSLLKIEGFIITQKIEASKLNDYSIFKLFLNGNLKNYGLQNSIYKISEVNQNKDGMIISTWKPIKATKFQFGKVITSIKDNQLFGIAFFDVKENLISKQIFTDYINLKGLMFPSKIIQITYTLKGEHYKITTFDKIILK